MELGKQLAKDLAPAIAGEDAEIAKQDASTRGLIEFYRANRTF